MHGVDGVLHLAAMIGVWRPMEDYHAVNVTGTENVCQAALAAGVRRFVHVSSWTIYGMGRGEPVPEGAPLKPLRESHVLTKVAGDKLVRRMVAEDGLPAAIVPRGACVSRTGRCTQRPAPTSAWWRSRTPSANRW